MSYFLLYQENYEFTDYLRTIIINGVLEETDYVIWDNSAEQKDHGVNNIRL